MIKIIALAVGLTATGLSFAVEQGKVVSVTPLFQQVAVPRTVCSSETVAVKPGKSGLGAVLGAVVGGVIGNNVARGNDRAAASVAGALGGAVVGNKLESPNPGDPQVTTVQRCGIQNFYENRAAGFSVVYEYAGKQYTVQMPQDPGPTVAIEVVPVGTANNLIAPAPQIIYRNYYERDYAPDYRRDYWGPNYGYAAPRLNMGYTYWNRPKRQVSPRLEKRRESSLTPSSPMVHELNPPQVRGQVTERKLDGENNAEHPQP